MVRDGRGVMESTDGILRDGALLVDGILRDGAPLLDRYPGPLLIPPVLLSLSLSLKAGFNSRCDLWPSVSD